MHLQLQQLECEIEALQFHGSAIGRDHRRDSRNHSPEHSRTRSFPGTQCCPDAASDRAFPGPCQKPTDATRNSSAPESGVHATPLIPPWIWRLAGFSEAWFGARTGWLLLRRRSGGRGHRAAATGGSERVGRANRLAWIVSAAVHSTPVQSSRVVRCGGRRGPVGERRLDPPREKQQRFRLALFSFFFCFLRGEVKEFRKLPTLPKMTALLATKKEAISGLNFPLGNH